MIGNMERTCSIPANQAMVPLPQRQIAVTRLSRRGIRTVSWLAAESRDLWPVANVLKRRKCRRIASAPLSCRSGNASIRSSGVDGYGEDGPVLLMTDKV